MDIVPGQAGIYPVFLLWRGWATSTYALTWLPCIPGKTGLSVESKREKKAGGSEKQAAKPPNGKKWPVEPAKRQESASIK